MPATGALVVVTTTIDNPDLAATWARDLLAARLVACVQVLPITSHYVWEGRLENTAEWRLECKTTATQAAAVVAWFTTHHTYQTPEILTLTAAANPAYQAWASGQCGGNDRP